MCLYGTQTRQRIEGSPCATGNTSEGTDVFVWFPRTLKGLAGVHVVLKHIRGLKGVYGVPKHAGGE